MTDNEFITLKEELDDTVAAFTDNCTNIMTKWAQRNIFLLKRDRCTNIFSKALQILDGLIHFHKAVIGTPSWPSVPPNDITLFLIKLYLSNEFLDINSLLNFFELPSDKINLICAQLLTNKNSEEAIITHLNSLLLTDINMQEDLQHDFIYETLLQFDQIIKIATIDTWSHYLNKTRHIDTGDSLKAKMAAFETIDATTSTMHAIAKTTKNLDNLENQNLQTQLRLANLEKATSRQEQKTNEVVNKLNKNFPATNAQNNYKGGHQLELMSSPLTKAPASNLPNSRPSKRQLVDLTLEDDEISQNSSPITRRHSSLQNKHLKRQKQHHTLPQKKIQWKTGEVHNYNPLFLAAPHNLHKHTQTVVPPLFQPAPPPTPLVAPSIYPFINPFTNIPQTAQSAGSQSLTNPFQLQLYPTSHQHQAKQKPSHKRYLAKNKRN
jgi:hypothetical protein